MSWSIHGLLCGWIAQEDVAEALREEKRKKERELVLKAVKKRAEQKQDLDRLKAEENAHKQELDTKMEQDQLKIQVC